MLRRFLRYAVRLKRVPWRMDVMQPRLERLEAELDHLRHEMVGQSILLEASRAETRAHVDAAAAATQHAAINAARQHAEAAATAAQLAAFEHSEVLEAATKLEIVKLRREVIARQRYSPRSTTEVHGAAAETGVGTSDGVLDAVFYAALEERFRGERAVIVERQRCYVAMVDQLVDDAHPLADLGCGRGEWLTLMKEARLPAIGVDLNPMFVRELKSEGLDVIEADLLGFLRDAEDCSLGAITLFQVVEHLPVEVLLRVLEESARVLRPGGLLIAETPNALNLTVAASTFWIDPTHQRPLHPEFLRFCALQAGFERAEGLFLNDLQTGYETVEDPVARRLLALIDGPGDFSLVASV
jgi:SAM-dependent methyltransferase